MGKVVWITGLSGSGKTFVLRKILDKTRERAITVIGLDGDDLRKLIIGASNGKDNYTRQTRLELAFKYSELARIIATQNVNVVIATISLFHEIHRWNRENLPGYYEVFLSVPLAELRRRDPKHIYRKYQEGKLKNVAGLDLSVDIPESPDLLLENPTIPKLDITVEHLVGYLDNRD